MGKHMKLTILSATMVVSLVTALSTEAVSINSISINSDYQLICINDSSNGAGVKIDSDGTGNKVGSDGTETRIDSDGTGKSSCMINKI